MKTLDFLARISFIIIEVQCNLMLSRADGKSKILGGRSVCLFILSCLSMYSRVHNSPPFGLIMKLNAYFLKGGNEGGRGTTPTSISIFDSFDMKTL